MRLGVGVVPGGDGVPPKHLFTHSLYAHCRFVTGLQDELKLAVTNANHSFNILASDESNTVTRKQFFSILEESNYEATDSEKREVIDIIQANGGLLDGDLDQIVENAFRAVVVPWLR